MRYIGLLVGTLSLLGCKTLHNRLDQNKAACGAEANSPQEAYLRLKDERGIPLTPVELGQAFVEFQDEKTTPLIASSRKTSRGCLIVPAKATRIRVVAPAAKKVAVVIKERNVQDVQMESVGELNVEPNCSVLPRATNSKIPIPFKLSANQNSSTPNFEITARSDRTGEKRVVYRSGGSIKDLASVVDLSKLQDDVYQIQLQIQDPFKPSSHPPQLHDRHCTVAVVHTPGTINNLSDKNEFKLFDTNMPLPWRSSKQDGQLYACFEVANGKELDQCNATKNCGNKDAFTKVPYVSNDRPGLFKAFAFVRDEAGNDSAIECRRLGFKSNDPTLDITWNEPRWNFEHAVMHVPLADFGVSLALTHDSLDLSRLPSKFECKAELVIEEKILSDSALLVCTSDSCFGESMHSWVSCDSNLQMTITDPLNSELQKPGRLTLHARVRDSDNSYIESKRSVAFSFGKDLSRPRFSIGGRTFSAQNIYPSADGFMTDKGDFFSYHNKNWDEKAKFSRGSSKYKTKFFSNKYNQDLFAYVFDDLNHGIYRRDSNGWSPVFSGSLLDQNYPCIHLTVDSQDQIWCTSANFKAVYSNSWQRPATFIEPMKISLATCPEHFSASTIDVSLGENMFWAICSGNVFKYKAENNVIGRGAQILDSNAAYVAKEIKLSPSGKIWLLLKDKKNHLTQLAFVENDKLIFADMPHALKIPWSAAGPLTFRDNSVCWRNYCWGENGTKNATLVADRASRALFVHPNAQEFVDLGFLGLTADQPVYKVFREDHFREVVSSNSKHLALEQQIEQLGFWPPTFIKFDATNESFQTNFARSSGTARAESSLTFEPPNIDQLPAFGYDASRGRLPIDFQFHRNQTGDFLARSKSLAGEKVWVRFRSKGVWKQLEYLSRSYSGESRDGQFVFINEDGIHFVDDQRRVQTLSFNEGDALPIDFFETADNYFWVYGNGDIKQTCKTCPSRETIEKGNLGENNSFKIVDKRFFDFLVYSTSDQNFYYYDFKSFKTTQIRTQDVSSLRCFYPFFDKVYFQSEAGIFEQKQNGGQTRLVLDKDMLLNDTKDECFVIDRLGRFWLKGKKYNYQWTGNI